MNGMAASDKIFKLLDLPEGSARTAQLGADCAIACRDLHFGYTAGKETLHGLNLDFPQQLHRAGGRERLRQVHDCRRADRARVRLHGACDHRRAGAFRRQRGQPAQKCKRSSAWAATSLKVRWPTTCGWPRPGADDGALWGALEQVNLADFLRSMDGLDTPLTEAAATCPAASGSGWHWPAHCCMTVPSTFLTRQRPTSTWRARTTSWRASTGWPGARRSS